MRMPSPAGLRGLTPLVLLVLSTLCLVTSPAPAASSDDDTPSSKEELRQHATRMDALSAKVDVELQARIDAIMAVLLTSRITAQVNVAREIARSRAPRRSADAETLSRCGFLEASGYTCEIVAVSAPPPTHTATLFDAMPAAPDGD